MKRITFLIILFVSFISKAQCDTLNPIPYSYSNIQLDPISDSSVCFSEYSSVGSWHYMTFSFIAKSTDVIVHLKPSCEEFSIQGTALQMMFMYDSVCTSILPRQDDNWVEPYYNYGPLYYSIRISMFQSLVIGGHYTIDINYFNSPSVTNVCDNFVCVGLYGIGNVLGNKEVDQYITYEEYKTPKYYTLDGKLIKPNDGDLVIEVIGDKRKMIIYKEYE